MKPAPLLALSLFVAATSVSCKPPTTLEQEVRRILAVADKQAFEYLYSESSGGRRVEVRGTAEDSFRHAETLTINGNPVMERIVNDDSLALHALGPEALPQTGVADPSDVQVFSALSAGRWVLDPAGAPPASLEAERVEQVGSDPLADAVNLYKYARIALQSAAGVTEFNPDAPGYQPSQDPFPHPDTALGERRLDLVRPPIPTQESGQFPTTANFRKMAFYMSEGILSRILEVIDIRGHEDVVRAARTGRNPYLLQLVRDLETGQGTERIRVRQMGFEILARGDSIKTAVPTDALVGNLQVLLRAQNPQNSD